MEFCLLCANTIVLTNNGTIRKYGANNVSPVGKL